LPTEPPELCVPPPVLPVDLGEFVEQAETTSVADKRTVEKALLQFMDDPL
jgi:hypothetical protein